MISVIIPTLNEEKNIGKITDNIRNCDLPFGERAEIIVSDGGSTDKTEKIAEEKGVRTVKSQKGRGKQINRGIEASEGDIILILHADTAIEKDIFLKIYEAVNSGASWGCCRIKMDSSKRIYRVGEMVSNLRALSGICFGDQGMFFTRSHLVRFGKFPEIPLMEDYEYSLRMKRLGIKPVVADTYLTASVRRFEKYGPVRSGINMYRLRHLYRMGETPENLLSMYDAKKDCAVIVFAKVPMKGFSKTRLEGNGNIDPLKLSGYYLEDALENAERSGCERFAAITPMGLSYRINIPEERKFSQEGQDLGERMKNAMEHVLKMGYRKVILIGTDVPEATYEDIDRACSLLDDSDIVAGPVKDGGYWLIGLKKMYPELFSMEYSHDRVFEDTRKIAESLGLKVNVLHEISDTDTEDDLREIFSKYRNCKDRHHNRALEYIHECMSKESKEGNQNE